MDSYPGIYSLLIAAIFLTEWVLDSLTGWLDLRSHGRQVPAEFAGVYADSAYARSREYLADRFWFELVRSTIFLGALLAMIGLGGFNAVDLYARLFAQKMGAGP